LKRTGLFGRRMVQEPHLMLMARGKLDTKSLLLEQAARADVETQSMADGRRDSIEMISDETWSRIGVHSGA